MRWLLLLLISAGCRRPLAPGETRCATRNVFGTMVTDCKSGPPQVQTVEIQQQPTSQANPGRHDAPDDTDDSPEAKELRAERRGEQRHDPAQGERTVLEGDRPLYCAVQEGAPTVGACFLDQGACNAYREESATGGHKFRDCEAREAGACFNYVEILAEKRRAWCSPSIADCEHRLLEMRNDPDLRITAKQCGIYRERKPGNDVGSNRH